MKTINFDSIILKTDMEEIFSSSLDWKKLKNKSIFVSGAGGMIASYLVAFFIYLNEIHDFDIKLYLNIRKKEKAYEKFGEYLNRDYAHLVTDDIVNGVIINDNINYIIHAASLASPQYYDCNPVETALPNVIGTYHLLEYAKKQKNFEGLLFFSSGSIYGKPLSTDCVSESTLGVFDFLDNGNAYAESKRCGEMLCHAYYSEYKIPVKSIRIYHTYSPSMDIYNDKRAFSEFIRNYIEGENIILKSKGLAQRAFCYITDAISGMFYVLFNGKNGESYNLGNPDCFCTIRKLAEIISNIESLKKVNVVFANRIDEGYRLSAECDSVRIPVSINKLRSLGWSPVVSSEDGFKRVVDYLLES